MISHQEAFEQHKKKLREQAKREPVTGYFATADGSTLGFTEGRVTVEIGCLSDIEELKAELEVDEWARPDPCAELKRVDKAVSSALSIGSFATSPRRIAIDIKASKFSEYGDHGPAVVQQIGLDDTFTLHCGDTTLSPRPQHVAGSTVKAVNFIGALEGQRMDEVLRTVVGIEKLQALCHGLAVASGWWDKERNTGEALALIHSEISEALEADRKGLNDDHLPCRDGFEVELADALIRIFDLAGGRGLDLATAVIEKLAYNQQRVDHKREERSKEGGKKY